jgi:hypothetical protein
VEWTKRCNGPGNGGDLAQALAVDAQGNVYVTGYSYGDGTNYDCASIKSEDTAFLIGRAREEDPQEQRWKNCETSPLPSCPYVICL